MGKLYEKYHDQGLEIMAFPCNQFMGQEPGTPADIRKFVTEKYGAKYWFSEKIDVNGDNTHSVYKWLKEALPGYIAWNFSCAFIINRDGVPVRRLDKQKFDGKIEEAILEELEKKPEAGAEAAADEKKPDGE